jgi:hypothetical protein
MAERGFQMPDFPFQMPELPFQMPELPFQMPELGFKRQNSVFKVKLNSKSSDITIKCYISKSKLVLSECNDLYFIAIAFIAFTLHESKQFPVLGHPVV